MYSKQEYPARDRRRNILRVGDTASRTRTVTARDIELFTEITGDRNPLHYDPRLARRSRFGGIVVQGGVTSGLLNAVVAEDLPGPGSVFLHVDWAFRAPVRPGDVITAEVEVTSSPGRQAGHQAVDHDHQPGRRRGSRWDSRRLARPGSREWLSAASCDRHNSALASRRRPRRSPNYGAAPAGAQTTKLPNNWAGLRAVITSSPQRLPGGSRRSSPSASRPGCMSMHRRVRSEHPDLQRTGRCHEPLWSRQSHQQRFRGNARACRRVCGLLRGKPSCCYTRSARCASASVMSSSVTAAMELLTISVAARLSNRLRRSSPPRNCDAWASARSLASQARE